MSTGKAISTNCKNRERLQITANTKRRDKSDLGSNFIAPDGGWGWMICIAQGFSNFSLFPALQQYGLIYSQPMAALDFNNKQITTILNVVLSCTALVGLLNGAIFRRFTFRQVAMFGSILGFVGILLSAFCTTFLQYIIFFAFLYGNGMGLCQSATSLAVNTYFKKRRRKATGFSWTLAGLGSIIFPHISTLLISIYGAQGTIWIFAAISLNAFLCGLTLQPVLQHVRHPMKVTCSVQNDIHENLQSKQPPQFECRYCQCQNREKQNLLCSTGLSTNDDPNNIEPSSPMLTPANAVCCDHCKDGCEKDTTVTKTTYIACIEDEILGYAESCCTCSEEKGIQPKITYEVFLEEEPTESRKTFLEKVVLFFDLDLLKNFTYMNLSVGMTVMMFGEVNFSILVPFILTSFGYANQQISMAMSILASMDILVRFLGPLALEKTKLGNQSWFAIGIITVSVGRMLVTLTDSYYVVLAVFGFIGVGKGLRTIFSPLIIPSYVPLNRLPAASGLQLFFNCIFTLACGPLLGFLTDKFDFKITIHFINVLTVVALLVWLIESLIKKYHVKCSRNE